MKPLSERIWSGDHEIVYESHRPYTFLLTTLSQIATPFLPLLQIEEEWIRTDAAISIQLRFVLFDSDCRFQLQRRGDYLDMDVLRYFNGLLFTDEFRFEHAPAEESIYFISAAEKAAFEREGIVFADLTTSDSG